MKPVVNPLPAQLPATISEPTSSRGRSKWKESYWSNTRLRVTVRIGQEAKTVIVPRPLAVVGSDPRCDIVLTGSRIPPRCFCLVALHGRLLGAVLADGSRSAIAKFGRVSSQRTLRVGGYQLEAALLPEGDGSESHPGHSDDTASDDTASDSRAEAKSKLQWNKGRVRHEFDLPFGGPILVGRRASCHVRIDDATMSSVHCLLLSLDSQLWLVDFCSRNGILIRRRRIVADAISLGHSFRIGKTRVKWLVAPSDRPETQVVAEAENRRWQELREEVARCRTDLEGFEAEMTRLQLAREQCQEAEQHWIQQQEEFALQRQDWQTRQQQEAAQLSQARANCRRNRKRLLKHKENRTSGIHGRLSSGRAPLGSRSHS